MFTCYIYPARLSGHINDITLLNTSINSRSLFTYCIFNFWSRNKLYFMSYKRLNWIYTSSIIWQNYPKKGKWCQIIVDIIPFCDWTMIKFPLYLSLLKQTESNKLYFGKMLNCFLEREDYGIKYCNLNGLRNMIWTSEYPVESFWQKL